MWLGIVSKCLHMFTNQTRLPPVMATYGPMTTAAIFFSTKPLCQKCFLKQVFDCPFTASVSGWLGELWFELLSLFVWFTQTGRDCCVGTLPPHSQGHCKHFYQQPSGRWLYSFDSLLSIFHSFVHHSCC